MQISSVSSINFGWPLRLCPLTFLKSLKFPEQVILALCFWAVGMTEKPKEMGLFLSLNKEATSKQQQPLVKISRVLSQCICYSFSLSLKVPDESHRHCNHILGKKKVGKETIKWGGSNKNNNDSQEYIYFEQYTILSALCSLIRLKL